MASIQVTLIVSIILELIKRTSYYSSKYNPIEHRLFPHLTRACSGFIFDSWKTVKSLMEKAKTRKGLRVFATILEGVYATGKKVSQEFKQNLPIIFDEYLPQWNYTVQPQSV